MTIESKTGAGLEKKPFWSFDIQSGSQLGDTEYDRHYKDSFTAIDSDGNQLGLVEFSYADENKLRVYVFDPNQQGALSELIDLSDSSRNWFFQTKTFGVTVYFKEMRVEGGKIKNFIAQVVVAKNNLKDIVN